MRYYIRGDTLFIRGSFSAVSTGPCGGLRPVSTVMVQGPADGGPAPAADPCREMQLRLTREGLPVDFFGVLSCGDIRRTCIVQYDFITTFIHASPGEGHQPDQVTVIVYSGEGLADEALLQMIMTVTSARVSALMEAGTQDTAIAEGHVIVASEPGTRHMNAGLHSEAGKRAYECVIFGMARLLEGGSGGPRPSLFVYSRLGGEGRFVLWDPGECPYYPCHFPGQACDYCYCPYYPCMDETLGQWASSSSGGRVWNCSRCTLLHVPENAVYLKSHPEASLGELKKLGAGRIKKQGL